MLSIEHHQSSVVFCLESFSFFTGLFEHQKGSVWRGRRRIITNMWKKNHQYVEEMLNPWVCQAGR